MKTLTPTVRQRLAEMRMPESEIEQAIAWMEQGEKLANVYLAITRLFQRTPQLNPASH
jgi:hypothetical protein